MLPRFNVEPGDAYVGYTALEAQMRKFRTVIYNKGGFEDIELPVEI